MSLQLDAAIHAQPPLPELPLVGKDGKMLCAGAPLEADAAVELQQVSKVSRIQPE